MILIIKHIDIEGPGTKAVVVLGGPMNKEWCDEYAANDLSGRKEHAKSMVDDYWKHKAAFDRQAQTLYANFLSLC